MIEPVDTQTFSRKVLKSPVPVVIDVWAEWCHPCKVMEPHFAAIAEKYSEQARFLKLNSDENPDLVKQYKIMGIPTLLFFNHGKLVARKTGVQRAPAIESQLAEIANLSADEAAAGEITGVFSKPQLNWGTVLVLLGAAIAIGGIVFNMMH